jgi:hypothetical protein
MGWWNLFTRGLPLRIIMVGTLTGLQWGEARRGHSWRSPRRGPRASSRRPALRLWLWLCREVAVGSLCCPRSPAHAPSPPPPAPQASTTPSRSTAGEDHGRLGDRGTVGRGLGHCPSPTCVEQPSRHPLRSPTAPTRRHPAPPPQAAHHWRRRQEVNITRPARAAPRARPRAPAAAAARRGRRPLPGGRARAAVMRAQRRRSGGAAAAAAALAARARP